MKPLLSKSFIWPIVNSFYNFFQYIIAKFDNFVGR